LNRETAIKNRILIELGRDPRVLAWNSPCGVFRAFDDPARVVRIGPAGRADLQGVVDGRALAIEVKTSTGRLRKEQEAWRDAFISRGGVWLLCRDAGEVSDQLREALSAH